MYSFLIKEIFQDLRKKFFVSSLAIRHFIRNNYKANCIKCTNYKANILNVIQ